MEVLQKQFDGRESLIAYVKTLAPWAEGERSYIQGGRQKAEKKLFYIKIYIFVFQNT